jgi:hypothetical protein
LVAAELAGRKPADCFAEPGGSVLCAVRVLLLLVGYVCALGEMLSFARVLVQPVKHVIQNVGAFACESRTVEVLPVVDSEKESRKVLPAVGLPKKETFRVSGALEKGVKQERRRTGEFVRFLMQKRKKTIVDTRVSQTEMD